MVNMKLDKLSVWLKIKYVTGFSYPNIVQVTQEARFFTKNIMIKKHASCYLDKIIADSGIETDKFRLLVQNTVR
jgi:hypothetical protein